MENLHKRLKKVTDESIAIGNLLEKFTGPSSDDGFEIEFIVSELEKNVKRLGRIVQPLCNGNHSEDGHSRVGASVSRAPFILEESGNDLSRLVDNLEDPKDKDEDVDSDATEELSDLTIDFNISGTGENNNSQTRPKVIFYIALY